MTVTPASPSAIGVSVVEFVSSRVVVTVVDVVSGVVVTVVVSVDVVVTVVFGVVVEIVVVEVVGGGPHQSCVQRSSYRHRGHASRLQRARLEVVMSVQL